MMALLSVTSPMRTPVACLWVEVSAAQILDFEKKAAPTTATLVCLTKVLRAMW
jgi:hypothetical protein